MRRFDRKQGRRFAALLAICLAVCACGGKSIEGKVSIASGESRDLLIVESGGLRYSVIFPSEFKVRGSSGKWNDFEPSGVLSIVDGGNYGFKGNLTGTRIRAAGGEAEIPELSVTATLNLMSPDATIAAAEAALRNPGAIREFKVGSAKVRVLPSR